jgi:hypothetical protein
MSFTLMNKHVTKTQVTYHKTNNDKNSAYFKEIYRLGLSSFYCNLLSLGPNITFSTMFKSIFFPYSERPSLTPI